MPGLAGLTTNTRRTPKYTLGGISTALGWNTLTAAGLPQATVDAATGKVLTVATGAIITRHEFDENSCLYSDDTVIGNNRYPKHLLGMKLGGRSSTLNDVAKTFDLVRTTWAVKTRSGEFLVLGMSNGLISEKNASGAGAGEGDFNGFDVVLSGGETAKAFVIDETAFNALAARVVADAA
jgi:hypothetical protein